MKSKIKKILKQINQYEQKIDLLNLKFLEDLQKQVNPDDYNIDEQIIIVVENKLECETVCSQIECNTQREKTLIQEYQKKVNELNEQILPLINQAAYLIEETE
ncbi:hypothetical protein ABPG73_020952, partial [Tetrahymena malaccensis]